MANLTDAPLPLNVRISGSRPGAPKVEPRIGRFFVTTNAMYIPDALIALDYPHVIPSGESKLLWLGVESTGAKAGIYQYEVTVKVGQEEYIVPLVVNVHNVILSRNTPLSTGNWSYLGTGEYPLTMEVRDTMLSHRITVGASSAQALPKKDENVNIIRPVEVDFSDMDKFIEFHKAFPQLSWYYPFEQHSDRPQHNWFGTADWMSDEFTEIFREWISVFIKHIKQSGRNYNEFYLQMFDETLDDKVARICRLVHSVDPEVRMMITFYQPSQAFEANGQVTEALKGLVEAGMNIFVYHGPRIEYENAPDGFKTLSSGDRELWFYGVGGKERDPLGFFRYIFWTAFNNNATGVHFWNMLWNRSSGWIDESINETYYPLVYTIGKNDSNVPADVKTAEKVLPSRRLEYVRMGTEDYMLMKIAKEKISTLGENGVVYKKRFDEIKNEVLKLRSKNRNLFRAKRRELVELVEELMLK